MIKNYVKIAWRSLINNKVSSLINIGGLAVGITIVLFNGLWVWDELSFNKYHANYDRIAQVISSGTDAKDGPFVNNSLPYPLATALAKDYKDNFSHIVRASWVQEYILSAGEEIISRKGQFMDEGAPEMLSLKMLGGSRSGLNDPYSIMLCESAAKALFRDADPVGRSVTMNNKTQLKVTGVYEDLPLNSQFKDVKFLSAWKLWEMQNDWIQKRAINDWNNNFIKLYAQIKPGTDLATVNKNISNAIQENIRGMEKFKEQAEQKVAVSLYPMSRWHLYPNNIRSSGTSPLRMVWLIGIIGIFVLLLACINFMNLSTARSAKRGRETGIRKALGSMRKQLIFQFYSESFLVVTFSFMLACLLVAIFLPAFNQLAAKEMRMLWGNMYFWLISFGFIFITSVLAGSYPALYLSSFKPIKVLKGTYQAGRFAVIPRKALVVMQFTVSVALVICTLVIYRQVNFAKDRPVGYTREGLLMMEMKSADFRGKYDVLRTSLLNTGMVAEMSESMGGVTEVVSSNEGFDWLGKDPAKDESMGTLAITHEYGKTVGWQFVAGRDFSRDLASDSSGVVMNEAAAQYIGLTNPVGETITWKWRDNAPYPYKVLGVIRNVVMESPYKPVKPTLFFVKALNGNVNWINIRVKPGVSMSQSLSKIEEVFRKLIPSAPFDYKFVDEVYAAKFAAEERFGTLVAFFSILAIFISCLGLFGLSSFTAEQRTKEIGVRKVLGASVLNIWYMLSKDFAVLVIISLLMAMPVAYYFMHNWLDNFPYRVTLSWWIFAVAGLGAMIITLLTISMQSIKAAFMNPVRSLKADN